MPTHRPNPRRTRVPVAVRPVLVALVLLASAAFASTTAGASGGCGPIHATPGHVSARALELATLCLLNGARAAHHLAPLRLDSHVDQAAGSYATSMVRGRFLSHFSRGSGPSDRMRRAGYRCRHRGCPQGEDIAWFPRRGTPASVVSLWMHSAGHRFNILYRAYRVLGLGIAPMSRRLGGAVYVADFTGR